MKQYFVDILDGDVTHLDTTRGGLATVEEAFSEASNGLAHLATQKLLTMRPCDLSARVRDEQDRFLCRLNIVVAITKSCTCIGAPPDSFSALDLGTTAPSQARPDQNQPGPTRRSPR